MRRVIHIYGASGSGTSTLGREIARASGGLFLDSDDYFWLPTNPKYTKKRPKEERAAWMLRDLEKAELAVVSGSLCGWGDVLIPCFTLAVRLETNTDLRLQRLRAREKAAFGSRIMPGGDMYETHEAFIAWAAQYDTGDENMRSLKKHLLWEKQLPCPILVLDGSADVERNAHLVLEKLKQLE